MNMSEDKEWIKDLEVGDKVFVRRGYNDIDMSTRIVKKITPKRNVRLNNDLLFKGGVCRQGVWSMGFFLVKYSEEKMNEILDARVRLARRRKLADVRWQDVSDELMDAVYDQLNEAGVFDES